MPYWQYYRGEKMSEESQEFDNDIRRGNEQMRERHYEYVQCGDCVHRDKDSPSPCSSCDQQVPTNFTEVEADDIELFKCPLCCTEYYTENDKDFCECAGYDEEVN